LATVNTYGEIESGLDYKSKEISKNVKVESMPCFHDAGNYL
jgi:hypothetical protein